MSAAGEKTPPVDVHEPSTERGYDRWAATYDGDGNPLPALEERERAALLGPVAGLDLLDLGTGTGRAALALAAAGARVTALDLSAGMLAVARAKQATAPAGGGRVRLVRADLAAPLPLGPARFDRVVSCLVLDHVADLARFFAEAARVLRPTGRLVVTVMHPAMNLRGSQARFVDPATAERVHVASRTNTLADYLNAALSARLELERVLEASPDESLARTHPRAAKYVGWPMLLGLALGHRPG